MPIETFPSANMHIRCLIQPTFQTPVLAQLPKDLRVFLPSPIYWSFFPFLLLFLHTPPFSPLHSSSLLLLLSIFFLSLSLSSPKVTDSISCLKYYYSPIKIPRINGEWSTLSSTMYQAKLTHRNLIYMQVTEMCTYLKVSSVVQLELNVHFSLLLARKYCLSGKFKWVPSVAGHVKAWWL